MSSNLLILILLALVSCWALLNCVLESFCQWFSEVNWSNNSIGNWKNIFPSKNWFIISYSGIYVTYLTSSTFSNNPALIDRGKFLECLWSKCFFLKSNSIMPAYTWPWCWPSGHLMIETSNVQFLLSLKNFFWEPPDLKEAAVRALGKS